MSPITTHVLDTRLGRPAAGITVTLEKHDAAGAWRALARGVTNGDGRVADLLPPGQRTTGPHRLVFDTGSYFELQEIAHFYPRVSIEFEIVAGDEHYHVPLLLSPFGYSTYRGS